MVSGEFTAARYSQPLAPDFPSDGDWLLKIVERVWRTPDGGRMNLDPWQRQLIRRVLELYPEGHPRAGELRYRQVVVSLARQNGKSVIGAIFGLYGLLRESGANVVGLASNADQARIVYKRVMQIIRSSRWLSARFSRVTDTRGISANDGGIYTFKPAKSDAVQGIDVSVGLCDELHIMPPELWTDMVNGTRARRKGIVIGITTAGDESSTLLKNLYEVAERGDVGERFGYFIWEAPEARVPTERDELRDYVLAANPAAQAGRLDVEVILDDIASSTSPPEKTIRYVLNRFVSSTSAFIAMSEWHAQRRPPGAVWPGGIPVFAIDRTPDWGAATVTANIRTPDGIVHTEVAMSLVRPDLEKLVSTCLQLAAAHGGVFAMDSYALKDLGRELKMRGLNVVTLTQPDIVNASARMYALIKQRKLQHAGDELLTRQLPFTVRKAIGEGFRISRTESSVEIDAVMSTTIGVLVAEQQQRNDTLQMF